MKKIISLIIIVLICFGIYTCISSRSSNKSTSSNYESSNTSSRHETCVKDATQCVYRNLSRQAMIKDLQEMGYSKSEIDNAMDDVALNFNYAAMVRAEKILEKGSFTKNEVYNSLVNDYLFTKKEAQYAVDNVKASWSSSTPKMDIPTVKKETKTTTAVKKEEKKAVPKITPTKDLVKDKGLAADLLRKTGTSMLNIMVELTETYKYSDEDALEELMNLDVDWYEVCLNKAIELRKTGLSGDNLYKALYSDEGFEKKEVRYAMSKVEDYF